MKMHFISDDPLYVGAMPCAPILTLRCSPRPATAPSYGAPPPPMAPRP